jgi:hypothetical protein
VIPDFLTLKLSKGSKPRAEGVMIFTASGWKARVFYYDDPKSMRVLGEGEEHLTREQALKKLGELTNDWKKAEAKAGKY